MTGHDMQMVGCEHSGVITSRRHDLPIKYTFWVRCTRLQGGKNTLSAMGQRSDGLSPRNGTYVGEIWERSKSRVEKETRGKKEDWSRDPG